MYLPRNYRHYWTFLILMAVELPFTIVILILTGIAAHNRYRTKLWQDGYDNGFNSAPNEILYALANYRPYHIPMVWSPFMTNYNLVLGVLSIFLLIAKIPMHLVRAFYPPLSAIISGSMMILFIVSARYQGGSDTSDPQHPQHGPPWYITKSCSVAAHKSNVGYCMQAKTLFAFSIMIVIIYFAELVLSLISCYVSKEERERHREHRREKRELKAWEQDFLKSPTFPMTPAFPTGVPPITPRTQAFNRLNGDSDLPFRTYYGPPETPHSIQQVIDESSKSPVQSTPQLFFPPPPKKAIVK